MRQLKRAITNWAQYKANCRSNSRQSCLSGGTPSQRSRYSRSRSSAPCTPNLSKMLETGSLSSRATTPSPRKTLKNRRSNDGEAPTAPKLSKEKSSSISDDINYVIPFFDEIEDEGHERSRGGVEYINCRSKSYENCRQKVTINSRKNSSNITNRTNSNSSEDHNSSKDESRAVSQVDANPYLELIAT